MNNRTWPALRILALIFAVIGMILIQACATVPVAVVMVSKDYRTAEPKRVALVGFRDYPYFAGSGEIAAGIFEKYLLMGEYGLVERRQVSEIMKEQALQITGAINPATLKKIGHLLGVQALVFGNVDDCTSPRDRTVMVEIPQEQTTPLYGEQETIQKKGDTVVKTKQPFISGFSTSFSSSVVPQEQTVPAHVGLSVRLVDVETGVVLWSASASDEGTYLNDAMENVSLKVMKALEKRLAEDQKKSQKN
jgi:hypothetical protein